MLNAGTSLSTKDWGGDDQVERWNRILSVNLFGVLHGTQAFTERMIAQVSCLFTRALIPANFPRNRTQMLLSLSLALSRASLSLLATQLVSVPPASPAQLSTDLKLSQTTSPSQVRPVSPSAERVS